MREQLIALIDHSHRPNVTLQVLPFAAGFGRSSSTFAIFEPRESGDRDVVNVESTGHDAYFDTPGEVAKYQGRWSDAQRRSLEPESSRQFITRPVAGSPTG